MKIEHKPVPAMKRRDGHGLGWRRSARDFPILKLQVSGKPLVYLDNAASSQMPQQVIDRIVRYQQRRALQHPPRGALPERAGHEGIRGGARQGPAFPECEGIARDHLHPRHHGGHQPGDARLRPPVHRQGRRDHPVRHGTSCEHRPMADAGRREGRGDPRDPDERCRRIADRRVQGAVQREDPLPRR